MQNETHPAENQSTELDMRLSLAKQNARLMRGFVFLMAASTARHFRQVYLSFREMVMCLIWMIGYAGKALVLSLARCLAGR